MAPDVTMTSLQTIWGTNETRQSRLIAQTLKYCPSFRDTFLEAICEAGSDKVRALIAEKRSAKALHVEVERERWLGAGDRIDLLVRIGDDLLIGIENKIGAALRPTQLTSYWQNLQRLSGRSLLILVAPSAFRLEAREVPPDERFVRVSYASLAQGARTCAFSPDAGFSAAYFQDLAEMWEDFDLAPLNLSDIAALDYDRQVHQSLAKLKTLLERFGSRIEHERGQYMLTCATRHHELPVFVGTRYGTGWYYKAPLLGGKPEAIAYLKEEKLLGTRSDDLNAVLADWAVARKPDVEAELGCTLDYYPRTGPNECRLAVRRSLETLLDKPDAVEQWLAKAQATLLSIPLPVSR